MLTSATSWTMTRRFRLYINENVSLPYLLISGWMRHFFLFIGQKKSSVVPFKWKLGQNIQVRRHFERRAFVTIIIDRLFQNIDLQRFF